MSASGETNGVVALTERLLSEAQLEGVPMGGGSAENAGKSASNGAIDAQIDTMTDVQFNFDRSFPYMTQRRLQRRYRGVYKQYSFTAQLVTWLVVIYTLSMLATLAFGVSYSTTNKTSTTSESLFYIVIVIAVVYVFVRVALIIRWLVYWVVVASMLGYAATGEVTSIFWLNDSDELTTTQKNLRNVVTIFLLVVEVLTIAIYYFTHFVYPWLVLNGKIDAVKWWNVKRHPTRSNVVTYRSWARALYTKKRNTITYCGGLDDEHRPHGYGMWTDSSFHGERLTGQWEHGIPVGPFRSFEHGSGYCFVNIRIGYCHTRGETQPDQIDFWPKHSGDGVHWGVASVECSVSGGFFKFLPTVRHLTPHNGAGDDAPKNASECVALLQSPIDSVIYDDDEDQDKEVHTTKRRRMTKRFESAKRLLFKESSCPIIDVDDSSPLAQEKEALVFLHGYNCSLNYAMNRLAQLISLGDFPASIHPFVFSWPSGGVLAYYQARDIGSQSDATAHAFHNFLNSLIDAGYTTINIIAHSMGARVYFQTLKQGLLDDVFEPVKRTSSDEKPSSEADSPRRARLATLTFANPDYERNEFVKRGGGYDLSRRFCRCITLYADNMDGALFYSEIFSKTSVIGPLNYSLGKRGHMIHRDEEDNANSTREDSGADQQNHHQQAAAEMDLAIALVNQRGHFDGVSSFAYNRSLRSIDASTLTPRQAAYAKKEAKELAQEQLEYLDMDVIDTTWMDNNVHAIRHNYFNLNPTVVDDLRSIVMTKRRASARPGLLKTTDNVYIFLVAPSHVKNK